MNLKTFLEHFDTIAEAPGGIPKLRSLILDLAVRGKLVSQNPADDSAFELIEKVRFTKKQLLNDKKIPKTKNLASIEDSDLPYEIPQEWLWVRLGEITKFLEYGTSEKASEVRNDVPVFRMNNIQNGKLLFENFKYVPQSIKDLPKLYLQDGDLLFNRTNSYELVGKTGLFRGENNRYTFASYLIRISLFLEYINSEFVNLLINSSYFQKTQIRPEIIQQCGQANFNGTKLQNTLIPLPPLAEQKRIVEKVDELMGLCDRFSAAKQTRDNLRQKLRESAIASLMSAETDEELEKGWAIVRDNWCEVSQCPEDVDDLRRSVLQLAVKGKLTSKNSIIEWKESQLKSFCTAIQTGPFGSLLHASDYISGGVPLINPQNIRGNEICITPDKTISLETKERLKNYVLKENDVILARRGELGRCAVVSEREDGWLCGTGSLFVRLSSDVLPEFIKLWLDSPLTRKGLEDASVGSTMNNLNQKILGSLTITIPPLAEQKRIVAKVDELMQLCDQLEASLRQSQQRAESLAASAISHLTMKSRVKA